MYTLQHLTVSYVRRPRRTDGFVNRWCDNTSNSCSRKLHRLQSLGCPGNSQVELPTPLTTGPFRCRPSQLPKISEAGDDSTPEPPLVDGEVTEPLERRLSLAFGSGDSPGAVVFAPEWVNLEGKKLVNLMNLLRD